MTGTITFNGNSLQTYDPATRLGIITNDITHTDVPDKDLAILSLANRNASVIPYTGYSSRKITIAGTIKGSSESDLDTRIDSFKALFNKQDQNLDIEYAGVTRRYIATVNGTSIKRMQKALFANFVIQFVCSLPFGVKTTLTTALNATARTNASYTDSHTFIGSAPYQLPKITITYANVVSSTTNLVANPGFETDLTGWSQAYGTMSRSTGQFRTGVASMQVVNSASPNSVPTADTHGWVLYQLVNLVPGTKYTLTAYVKGNAGGEAIRMSMLGSSVATLAATTGWQAMTVKFTASGTNDQIYIYSTTASATWFIDDVAIVPSVSAFVAFSNSTNGQGIIVPDQVWDNSDVLEIDTYTQTVKKNGVEIDFVGAFPEFEPGSQSFSYSDGFITRTFDQLIQYSALYL